MGTTLHCWADEADYAANEHGWCSDEHIDVLRRGNGTCMLEAGHDGPHEWTPDADIEITVSEETA